MRFSKKIRQFKELSSYSKYQSRQYKHNRLILARDIVNCRKQYGATILNYATFHFAEQPDPAVRDDYLTSVRLHFLEAYFQTPQDPSKAELYRIFGDFYGRDILIFDQADQSEVIAFLERHPVFFAKVPDGYGGKGVYRLRRQDFDNDEQLIAKLDELRVQILEEPIVQHPDLEALAPNSINTLRLSTFLAMDGSVHFAPSILRMGSGESYVDNVTSGGMYIHVEDEGDRAGIVTADYAVTDRHCVPGIGSLIYTEHPKSKQAFRGFKVPYFAEAKEMVRQLAAREPLIRIRGWDIAITPSGPCIVEVNGHPGIDMCQNYAFIKQGLMPLVREVYGLSFEGTRVVPYTPKNPS